MGGHTGEGEEARELGEDLVRGKGRRRRLEKQGDSGKEPEATGPSAVLQWRTLRLREVK